MLHSTPHFTIYFGDAQDKLSKEYYQNLPNEPLLSLPPFSNLKTSMALNNLFFLRQTHSVIGKKIDGATQMESFKDEGDFLITKATSIGIGIMTADCLPIIFYDPIHNAIAIAHAGWRGSVDGIAIKTLQALEKEYKTKPYDVIVFFGPSAKACCYEVSDDFKNNITNHMEEVLLENSNNLYFDVCLYNKLQLESHGVKEKYINTDYNLCTICNNSYYSHRRDNTKIGWRQMTVISLK